MSVPVADAPAAFVLRSSVSEQAGNAWAAWREMGSPASPSSRQLDALRESAEPDRRHASLPVTDGRAELTVTLDRHEVTLVELSPVHDETPPWLDDARLFGRGPEEQGTEQAA